ncbi:MAG: hypothetical protein HY426_03705 [Candidatus Levybacteria bacterium]|nr:hypothetical protein [Candidatus Levybacteria bacterium]
MNFYLSIPLLFLKFWYIDAPIRLIRYFFSVNHAALQILSLPLMARTYFKPLKNEYRKGLVAFSIGMGIFVKTVLIFVDLVIFLFVILLEIGFLVFFIWWPAITVLILIIK